MVSAQVELNYIIVKGSILLIIGVVGHLVHIFLVFIVNVFYLVLVFCVDLQLLLIVDCVQIINIPLYIEPFLFWLLVSILLGIVMHCYLSNRNINVFPFHCEIVIEFTYETELECS